MGDQIYHERSTNPREKVTFLFKLMSTWEERIFWNFELYVYTFFCFWNSSFCKLVFWSLKLSLFYDYNYSFWKCCCVPRWEVGVWDGNTLLTISLTLILVKQNLNNFSDFLLIKWYIVFLPSFALILYYSAHLPQRSINLKCK